MLIGALRDPPPIGDIEQRPLFNDTLVLVAGRGHPLHGREKIDIVDLADFPIGIDERFVGNLQSIENL